MSENLYDMFVKGELDELLSEGRLHDGEQEVFSGGFGRVVTIDGRTVIEMSVKTQPGPECLPREVLRTSAYRLEAQTRNGWRLECSTPKAILESFHSTNNTADWVFGSPRIIFSRRCGPSVTGAAMRILIDPLFSNIFTSHSVHYSEGFDPQTKMDIDWSHFKLDSGTNFSVSKGTDICSYVKTSSESPDSAGLELQSNAFINAIALALGRRIRKLATLMVVEDLEKITLFVENSERKRQRAQFPLLPLRDLEDAEKAVAFIKEASRYFIEQPTSPLMTYLGLFYDSLLLSFQSACLHLTTGVEGLRDLILDENPIEVKQADKEDREKLRRFKHWRDMVLKGLPESNDADDSAHIQRLRECILQIRSRNRVDGLILAAKFIERHVTAAEAKNWERLRDHAAHGAELNDKDEVVWEQFCDSLNLLYRFACGIVGWKGDFRELSYRTTIADNSGKP